MEKLSAALLANPRGFCAGVDRAIAIVNQLLKTQGAPIYVKHEIVHNRHIVEDFKQRGVHFIEDPNDVPAGATLVFSAHGVSEAIRQSAAARQLNVYDATCPLVTKVHAEVKRLRANGYEIVMLGHAAHPEVEGTLGQVADGVYLVENEVDIAALNVHDADKLAYVTQTTLSVDDTTHLLALLKKRFPAIHAPAKSDICYATQNRQDAVKALSARCDLIFVVGSRTSSNSNRLCEVARQRGVRAHLIDGVDDIQREWLADATRVGVTAGASAPEELVAEVVAFLRQAQPSIQITETDGAEENIVFAMPKKLLRGETGVNKANANT